MFVKRTEKKDSIIFNLHDINNKQNLILQKVTSKLDTIFTIMSSCRLNTKICTKCKNKEAKKIWQKK